MKRLVVLAVLFSSLVSNAWAEVIIVDQVTGVASYVSASRHKAKVSGEAAARYYLRKYRKDLGIDSIKDDLRLIRSITTKVSARYNFQQLSNGRRVLGGIVGVTLQPDQQTLISISSAYNPRANELQAVVKITAREAVAIAKGILPSATESRARELVMMQPVPTKPDLKFVWLVDVEDPEVGTFMTYAINAVDGFVEDSIALQHSARNRITKDAQTNAIRNESDVATGNVEIDSAHSALGEAHDYFYNDLGFDSFDGAGGAIQSLVNDPDSKNNAYYKHKAKGLYFGPGMVTLDVAVHEFAHGVVAHTAGLIYRGQAGALNESYADVFGVIVDADDWLLGEDLPSRILAGNPALRDIRNPSAINQPGEVQNYQAMCGVDFDGVHTNSGIPNRGFYEVANRIGREDAGKIYFQALTSLSPKADFATHRQATLDAARVIFPGDEPKVQLVQEGLAAAGLVESMSITVCPTSSCPIASAADELRLSERRGFVKNIAAAYRLRDEVLRRHKVIGDFSLGKYAELSGDLASTVFTNPSMALEVISFVRKLTPVINRVGDGELEQHKVTEELVQATTDMITKVMEAFKKAGKKDAAGKLDHLASQFDLSKLVDKTYSEAMDILRQMIKKAREGEQQGQEQGEQKEESGDKGTNQPEGSEQGETEEGEAEQQEGEAEEGEAEQQEGEAEEGEAEQQEGEQGEGQQRQQQQDAGQDSGEEQTPQQGRGSTTIPKPQQPSGQGQGQGQGQDQDQGQGRSQQNGGGNRSGKTEHRPEAPKQPKCC